MIIRADHDEFSADPIIRDFLWTHRDVYETKDDDKTRGVPMPRSGKPTFVRRARGTHEWDTNSRTRIIQK